MAATHLDPPPLVAALRPAAAGEAVWRSILGLRQRPSAVLLRPPLPLVPPQWHVAALIGLQWAVHLNDREGKCKHKYIILMVEMKFIHWLVLFFLHDFQYFSDSSIKKKQNYSGEHDNRDIRHDIHFWQLKCHERINTAVKIDTRNGEKYHKIDNSRWKKPSGGKYIEIKIKKTIDLFVKNNLTAK